MNPMKDIPVKKLMAKMGVPIILSMMMQALYNIVDTIFVGNMGSNGELANNALALVFPIQVLIIALGIGTGVGMNVMVSRCLGEGNREKASLAAGVGKALAGVIFIIFFLFGIIGVRAYISSQAKDPISAEMGIQYLRIVCMLSAGNIYFTVYEKLLQAHGRSKYSTIAQIAGALTNIVLDPILIYGLLGLPRLEVVGAAVATVIGQFVSMFLGLYFHHKYDKEVSNHRKYIKLDWTTIKAIYAVGFPAIIAQGLLSVMTYLLNIILGMMGQNMQTAYGIYYKIQQFIIFAAFGMRDAITPIISFAYGMQDQKRIKDGIKYGILYTLTIMLIGTILLETLAAPFAGVFGLSGETAQICETIMRIVALSFVFAGLNIAFQGIFQALDGGLQSLLISILRQFILVIPVAYLFTKLAMNQTLPAYFIWVTFLFAEIVTALLGWLMLKRHQRKVILTSKN